MSPMIDIECNLYALAYIYIFGGADKNLDWFMP